MTEAPLPARVARIAEASLALDGKTALKVPSGSLSTAEAIAVMVRASNTDEIAADRSVLLRPWPAGREPWIAR
jgi:hypothetical protein